MAGEVLLAQATIDKLSLQLRHHQRNPPIFTSPRKNRQIQSL
jgi:hypothetical protein